MTKLLDSEVDAIANADAYLNNVALPTYSRTVNALVALLSPLSDMDLMLFSPSVRRAINEGRDIVRYATGNEI